MSTEIQTKEQEEQEVLAKKGTAWSNFGQSLYIAENQLQARAQSLILKLKHPKTIEEVADSEKTLKEVKSEALKIDADRKQYTQRFDAVAARLMEPKKLLDEQTKAVEASIIAVKSDYAKKQKAEQDKVDELKRIKEYVLNAKAQVDLTFKNKIQETITKAYENALGAGNVSLNDVSEYLDVVKTRYNHASFTAELPNKTLIYATQEEYNAIADEFFTWSTQEYIDLFHNDLQAKFLDYGIALQNKKEALELSVKQEAEKAKQNAVQAQNASVAAALETIAQPLMVTTEVKALKKSYEIDMPETIESVLTIMAAFSANINLCMPKLKVNKWFAFTPAQAGTALAKVKCDDNNFAPTGIKFKEIEKL